MKFNNFKNFLGETYTSYDGTVDAFGRYHQNVDLEFPEEIVTGPVFSVKTKGVNYEILIAGGSTVLIPRKTYDKKFNRLPKKGEIVTAVFYKFNKTGEKNKILRDFKFTQV